MNNPLDVIPSKGNQGTTQGKEKILTFSVRPRSSVGRVTVDLIQRSWVRFPLGSNGIREPHEVKKKSFDLGGKRTHDLRIRSTVTLPTELRGRTEKVGDD